MSKFYETSEDIQVPDPFAQARQEAVSKKSTKGTRIEYSAAEPVQLIERYLKTSSEFRAAEDAREAAKGKLMQVANAIYNRNWERNGRQPPCSFLARYP